MSFQQRLVSASFTLATGTFKESGTNTVTIKDLRISASISKAGTQAGTAHLRIYGMTLSLMNQLSTLGIKIDLLTRNTVTISAGDAVSGMGTVFVGTVLMAFVDSQSMPDVALDVSAQAGAAEGTIPADATSFNGATSVALIMTGLASKMQLTFENSGVTGTLANPNFPGSYRDQAAACAEAGHFHYAIDNGKLAIWPLDGARSGQIPVLAPPPAGEMIGYPTYTDVGLMIRSVFNPSINFGGQIKVQSSLTPANGIWNVYELSHNLESMVRDGQWFSTISAYNPNSNQPVLAD